MAAYNGELYLAEQIDSILPELGDEDELIIVDDGSTDKTIDIISGYTDARIVLHRSSMNRGYVRAFEAALGLARGRFLLLADQDDVWIPGRVSALVDGLERAHVVASNLVILDSNAPLPSPFRGRPWALASPTSKHPARNVLGILTGQIPYFGCAMGVRREFLPVILPFPEFLTESHDLWIALNANTARSILHIDRPTLWRRIHESNASTPRPRGVWAAIRSRMMLVRALWASLGRVRGAGLRDPHVSPCDQNY